MAVSLPPRNSFPLQPLQWLKLTQSLLIILCEVQLLSKPLSVKRRPLVSTREDLPPSPPLERSKTAESPHYHLFLFVPLLFIYTQLSALLIVNVQSWPILFFRTRFHILGEGSLSEKEPLLHTFYQNFSVGVNTTTS